MAITISFINQKGGVGKTTSSVNTSAILAERGYAVLLIDLDPQANTTGYYDMYDSKIASIYDVMLRGVTVMDVIRETSVSGLYLLPSILDFSRAELELSQILMRQEYVLKDELSAVSDSFDFIIIDCPPARNKITINALTASDYVITPTIPDHFAIESIISMGELLNQVKSGVNPNLQVLGILITIDELTSNKKAYKEVLQSGELLPCFDTAIRKNTKLQEAINAHLPINLYDKNSSGSKDYNAFVEELLFKTVINSGFERDAV